MALNRHTKRVDLGDGRVRYLVRMVSDPCDEGGLAARQVQRAFMRHLADDETLLQCGPTIFQRVVITHNGTAWQADAEAEVDEEF